MGTAPIFPSDFSGEINGKSLIVVLWIVLLKIPVSLVARRKSHASCLKTSLNVNEPLVSTHQ